MSRYFIRRTDGTIEGPFSSTDLRVLAKCGEIRDVDLVRRDGERLWVRANKVGGLRDVIAQAALELPDRPESTRGAFHAAPRRDTADHRVVPLGEDGEPSWPADTPPFGLPPLDARAVDGPPEFGASDLTTHDEPHSPDPAGELGAAPPPPLPDDSGMLVLDAEDPAQQGAAPSPLPDDSGMLALDADDLAWDAAPSEIRRPDAMVSPPQSRRAEVPDAPPPAPQAGHRADDDLFADLELPPPVPTRAPPPPPPPPPPRPRR